MKRFSYLLPLAFLISCGTGGEKSKDDQAQNDSTSNQTETPAEPKIVGQEISYEGDSITMKGYIAYDENLEGKRPGILIVHEWWGHNEHTRNAADKLAKQGYVAFALDMYGDGKTAYHPEDAKAFSSSVMQDFDGAKARFNAAMEALKRSEHVDQDEIGAIGYCFGGGVVLNMARQGAPLEAVATFHGSLGAVEPAEKGAVKARILVMNGEDDPFVPAKAQEAFKAEMDSAGANFEFVNYPDAVHAFTNPAATEKGEKFDLPLAYNKEADENSWARLETFLQDVFGE